MSDRAPAAGDPLPDPARIIDGLRARAFHPGLIPPDYQGYCLTHLPALIRRAFGLEAPLPAVLAPLVDRSFSRVLLLILDALGYRQFEMCAAVAPPLQRLLDRGRHVPVTAPFPTTTTVALTTIYSGLSPAEHGIPGHNAYLRELGAVVDILRFSPAGEVRRDVYKDRGVDIRALFPIDTIFQQLARAGIEGVSITRREFVESALGRLHHEGGDTRGYLDAADLFVLLRQALREADGPRFVAGYWDSVDMLSHVYGPFSEVVQAAGAQIGALLEREILAALTPAERRDTLLIVTADHGQLPAAPEEAVLLSEQRALADTLLLPPTGQPRAAFLYPTSGAGPRLEAAMAPFADRLLLLPSAEAIDRGLFGPPEAAHHHLSLRVGEYAALGLRGAQLLGPNVRREEVFRRGRHGSLSEEEVLVPLIALPLEAW